jgi:hypothetical protein
VKSPCNVLKNLAVLSECHCTCHSFRSLKFYLPALFLCIYSICLVSNLIGLDDHVTIDGNDDIEKSPVFLSQSVSKSTSAKGTKQRKKCIIAPPPSRKRTIDTHRDSVSNVSDLRLQKRGKVQKEQISDCMMSKPLDSEAATQTTTSTNKLVTPSPHPDYRRQNSETTTPRRNDILSSTKRSEITNQYHALPLMGQHPNNNPSLKSARVRAGQDNSRSSWFQEKNHQKTAQQTAFSK